MKFKLLFIGLLMATLVGCKPSLCEPNADDKSCHFPCRIGYVNDYCDFLTADDRAKLERSIAAFHAKTGKGIIIVVEDSKKSHSRKFHCPQGVAEQWKLGPAEQFDGFLIVVSRKRDYVDFTYGLEFNHKLTIEAHNHLLYEVVVPAFKRKKYYEGLRAGIEYFISHQTDHSIGATRP